ncbi:MAG: hypothetical protein M3R24_20385 [Chloroflexota bacterium]|nr:hypothetical protein [Chloroflexota bacterium]
MTASVFLGWLGLVGGCLAFVAAISLFISLRQSSSRAQSSSSLSQRRTISTVIVLMLGFGITQCLSALIRFTDNTTVELLVSIGYIIAGLGQLAWLWFIVKRDPITDEAHKGLLLSGRLLHYLMAFLGITWIIVGVIGFGYA